MTTSLKAPQDNPVRVLIADDEPLVTDRLVEFLNQKGFSARAVRSGAEVSRLIRDWVPDFILYDLMLPGGNALEFLRDPKRQVWMRKTGTRILVYSGHNDERNVRDCMQAGAADYIAKPARPADLLARLVLHLHPKREMGAFTPGATVDRDSAQYFIHLTDLTLREALKGTPVVECLYRLTGLIGLSFDAVRVSIVRAHVGNEEGEVIASSDKRRINGLKIELAKYPEIQFVMNNDRLLALDHLPSDPTMAFVTRLTKSIQFSSMLVAPIQVAGQPWGVLSIRHSQSKRALSDFELRYAQLVAHVIGLVVIREPQLWAATTPPTAQSA